MKFEVQLEEEGDSEMFEDLARYVKYHPRVARFLFNPAGFTFLIGWFLFFGMTIGWITIALVDPNSAQKIALTVATEFFPGKEAAVFLGIVVLNLHPVIVWGIYPLFYLFRRRQTGRQTFFGYFFAKMERSAKRHQKKIEKYGGWGIFLFMLIPFAVNGSLVGAIVGKLAGVRTRYILPAVIGSTMVSSGYWVVLWYFFRDQTAAFVAKYGGPWIAGGLAVLVVLFLLKNVIDFWRELRHFREIQARRRELIRSQQHEQTLFVGETVEVDARPGSSDD
jgi:uncharacterized membrane protein